MRGKLLLIRDWVEERTGWPAAVREFLGEQIPASAGWAQVFGSVALFLFLTQAVTGILLALNFAASPAQAYASLDYIAHQVAGGSLVRGLHHWGASAMVVTVCLHMLQVFVYGAYKKPREATWIAGVLLLLLTLSFGLTGYLLPWDNKAYWGTVVTANVASGVPFAGPLLARLIGAADQVGVVTFSRFYAFHTVVLPAATVLLIAVHVALVRRHGVAPLPDNAGRTRRFYPRQVFRDLAAVFVTFLALFLAADFWDVPLEKMADPGDTSFVPRPEWYFLFLFQLLKLFPGRLEFVGTVLLPSAALLALVLLPFWRGVQRRVLGGRLQAAALAALAVSIWGSLTAAAALDGSRQPGNSLAASGASKWTRLPPEAIAGAGEFRTLGCNGCHNLLSGEPKRGPTLGLGPLHHPNEWVLEHIRKNPSRSAQQIATNAPDTILQFVGALQPGDGKVVAEIPEHFISGARIYVARGCSGCHQVGGRGGKIGPPLDDLRQRRSQQWVKEHFLTPARLSPGSTMPPYRFAKAEENDLVAYLFSLPE